jgi:hypothetical protein
MSGWQLKLAALAWAEFQVAAKKQKRIEALWDVADAFGLKEGSTSVQDWREAAEKHLGREFVRETLESARIAGQRYRSLSEQIANRKISKSTVEREIKHYEDGWAPEELERIGRAFCAIPNKAEARKKKSRGETGSP